jgi:hypothetical protein
MFILVLRIQIFSIPDPGTTSKNSSILTQKIGSQLLEYDSGCSSRIPDPDPEFLSIPDPGVKKALDPGSGSATLLSNNYLQAGPSHGSLHGINK